jgi:hypothetical protein
MWLPTFSSTCCRGKSMVRRLHRPLVSADTGGDNWPLLILGAINCQTQPAATPGRPGGEVSALWDGGNP